MSEQLEERSDIEVTSYRVQGFSCANCAGKFEKNVKSLAPSNESKDASFPIYMELI